MRILSNFHTHTTFCDGRDTPEVMAQTALELGMKMLGFSGHSNTPFDPGYCMDEAREEAYRQEVLRQKARYSGRLALYLGLEQDYYSAPVQYAYDYLIGSVHYVEKDGTYLSVDDTPEKLREGVDALYGGDFYALIRDYYRLVAQLPQKTHCQIIGHFDLITKFNEKHRFFSESDPRYRDAALEALHCLLDQNALLELNTGGMSRGWKKNPYPARFLLEEIGKREKSMIFSSDAHRKEDILFGSYTADILQRDFKISILNP